MTKSIYAIGFRDWIELREATKPPREYRTSFVRNVKQRYGFFPLEKVPFKFTVVTHMGGKVICTLKRATFNKRVPGLVVHTGEMKLVPSRAASQFSGRLV